MTRPLVYHSLARREIDEAYDWYEARSPGRGDRFLAALNAAVQQIHQNPHLRAVLRAGIRAQPIRKYRYVVDYRDEPTRIHVVAVQDGRRHPRRWRHRR